MSFIRDQIFEEPEKFYLEFEKAYNFTYYFKLYNINNVLIRYKNQRRIILENRLTKEGKIRNKP
jgi:hypothetical protein